MTCNETFNVGMLSIYSYIHIYTTSVAQLVIWSDNRILTNIEYEHINVESVLKNRIEILSKNLKKNVLKVLIKSKIPFKSF